MAKSAIFENNGLTIEEQKNVIENFFFHLENKLPFIPFNVHTFVNISHFNCKL